MGVEEAMSYLRWMKNRYIIEREQIVDIFSDPLALMYLKHQLPIVIIVCSFCIICGGALSLIFGG